jgi:hypothetical protein
MDSKLNGVFINWLSASLDDTLKELGFICLLKLRGNESVRFGVHWKRLEGCAAGVKATRVVKLQRTTHI